MKGIINYFYFIYLKIVIKNESRSLSWNQGGLYRSGSLHNQCQYK
jgi:hypothetical protein